MVDLSKLSQDQLQQLGLGEEEATAKSEFGITYTTDENQFVTFKLDEETYGIEILKVQSIIAYEEITLIPNVPNYIKGVLNLRGSVIPIIDLRLKFNMEQKEYNLFTVIMVAEIKERLIGMVVDNVADVVSIPEDNVNQSPGFSTKIDTSCIKGVGNVDDRLIIIIDVEKMLLDDEIAKIDNSSQANDNN